MNTINSLKIAGALAVSLKLAACAGPIPVGVPGVPNPANSQTGQAVKEKAGDVSASFKAMCQKPAEELNWGQRTACKAAGFAGQAVQAGKDGLKKADEAVSGAIKGGPNTPANE